MESPAVLPQYKGNDVPLMRTTTIRISQRSYDNLKRLLTATGAPNDGALCRLLVDTEYSAMQSGCCHKEDYAHDDERKPFALGFKLAESDREKLREMILFYDAKNMTHLFSFMFRKYSEAVKDGE